MACEDDPAVLRKEAARCRRLASSVGDLLTLDRLGQLAMEYDGQALRLEERSSQLSFFSQLRR